MIFAIFVLNLFCFYAFQLVEPHRFIAGVMTVLVENGVTWDTVRSALAKYSSV